LEVTLETTFKLDHNLLAADVRFATLAHELSKQPRIDSQASFNQYCRTACHSWDKQFGHGIGTTTDTFSSLLTQIDQGGEDVIQTPWGGVVITLHEHPKVEKYLVIRKGGYLALEMHAEKDEHLEVREGAGLILSRSSTGQPLVVQALAPGDKFHFEPGMEHCIIGTENLLVFERSTDPKGMDQDLIFIYEPD